MDVYRVSGEVVSPTSMVKMTVGADDDARSIVPVDQTALCEILIQVTYT